MNRTSLTPQLLLFDLGGVLVRWEGLSALPELFPDPSEQARVRRTWSESPWVRRFETGKCTPDEFARGILGELELKMASAAFLAAFTSWIRGPYPGALELLEALAPRFDLACLSNTNTAHWRKLRDEHGLHRRFKRCYLSFEIGWMKPDREVFDHVLADSGCPARQILFLDDNRDYVDAARRLGFQAVQVDGLEGVRQALDRLGLLP